MKAGDQKSLRDSNVSIRSLAFHILSKGILLGVI